MPTGYTESHTGGTETFPITINPGVTVKKNGTSGYSVAIWSSATTPPASILLLEGVTTGTAATTRIEDLFIFGGVRGIEIADNVNGTDAVDFSGVIARCQFGGNSIGIDAINETVMEGDFAIRDCKITSIAFAAGNNAAPNLQDPSVGIRLHSIGNSDTNSPPVLNVEIRNLRTAGIFDSMETTNYGPAGTHDLGSATHFTRLVEVVTEQSGFHEEHAGTFDPIPEVNVEFDGGVLEGKADENATSNGWDVGVYASTDPRNPSNSLLDFGSGYQIETSGTIVDGFKLAGIHATSTRWNRGEVILNSNTIVRETGRHTTRSAGENLYCGIHLYSEEAYMALTSDGSSSLDNLGHGIFMRTKSTIENTAHAAPSGNFINIEEMEIHENGGSGIHMRVDSDGIVGGAWHFPDDAFGNPELSLRKMSGWDYSVDYGQGIVNGCSISNNGEYGVHFRPSTSSSYVNARIVNTIIWNNPDGGYYADLRADEGAGGEPTFLVPLGHCTLAGNGGSSSSNYSIEVEEEGGKDPDYKWTGLGGTLTTKFYNTILERQSSSDDDFAPGMVTGSSAFVLDDDITIDTDEIGAAGLRYQDGGMTPIFDQSIYTATPFVDASSWTTLDASNFYLLNVTGGFGSTPTTFPLVGNETAFDHEGDLRAVASGGTRDKGADEL